MEYGHCGVEAVVAEVGLGHVLLYEDDESGRWVVEAREDGADGDSRWWDLACEPYALHLITALTEDSPVDQWRELPVGHTR